MEGTIAEIRFFGSNFAPRSWAFCQGQLLSIAQNTALFALLGTTFGGNGQTTFALPDFRNRIAVGTGQAPGLSSYSLGQVGGANAVTLNINQLPAHTHPVSGTVTIPATAAAGNTDTPAGAFPATLAGTDMYASASTPGSLSGNMTSNLSISNQGGSQPFSIQSPGLGFNFIICMEGIFPSRN